jgi:hypothetical protein
MGYHFKLLVCLFTIVLATHSFSASNDEVSTANDLAKRQEPGKYQHVTVQLQVFQAVTILLHFVWDCVVEAFVTRTAGAGRTTSRRFPNSLQITAHPDGGGVIPPRSSGNPFPAGRSWHFDGQSLEVTLATTLDDDDNLVLHAGDWIFPDPDLLALTVTDLYNRRSAAQLIAISVDAQEDGDPNNPPSAEGAGFGTISNNSAPAP